MLMTFIVLFAQFYLNNNSKLYHFDVIGMASFWLIFSLKSLLVGDHA